MASAACFLYLDEQKFLCAICHDVFTDPVTTWCGHNFCKACLQHMDSEDDQCPTCKKFPMRPGMRINTMLSELAVDFKKNRALLNPIPDRSADGDDVLCDVCPERKDKAVKSCLKCLCSFCETHLEPHRRVAGLKSHLLTAPVSGLEDLICKNHRRASDLYCKTDQTWICRDCMKSDHKKHHVVTLEQEYDAALAELPETPAKLQGPAEGVINAPSQRVRGVKHAIDAGKREGQMGNDKRRPPWKY